VATAAAVERAAKSSTPKIVTSPPADLHMRLAKPQPQRHECVDKGVAENRMQMETKCLRLRNEVALGSQFGDWHVCWLGGWAEHRLYYLVMLVRVPKEDA
jgi:hypothetical protein